MSEEEQDIVVEEPEQQEEEDKTSVASAPEESELDSYSKGVQSRIKKLTEKYRQEERDKAEAVRVSTQLLEENKKLKSRVQALDTGYLNEYGSRIESQTDAAKRVYKEAYEAGDTDKMLEAQQALSNIAIETQRYNTAKARADQQAKVQVQRQQQQQQAPQQQQALAFQFAKVKKLFLSHNGLSSLNGVELFPNLTHLSISHNKLLEVDELGKIGAPSSAHGGANNAGKLQCLAVKGNFFLERHPDYKTLIIRHFTGLKELDS